MTTNAARWLQRLFDHEGGYVDDPNDPGGRTKYGISANSYPDLDIKNLTLEAAAEIYRRDFLQPIRADEHEDGVAFQLFDFAVNSGPHQALKAIQHAVGVTVDGIIGPVTLAAIRRHTESDLIMLVLAERLEFMTGLPNWPHHGRGWARRIATNLRYGAKDS